MARRPSRSSITADQEATLAEEKRASTLQLLFRAARLLDEAAVARVRAVPDAPALRTAHTALLPHLDFTGVRLTDLAARVGVSKQAVGQLIDDMEAAGAVERIADPEDGRAKLIRLSRRGHASILQGLGVLRAIEDELRQSVGARRMDELRRALEAVLAVVDRAAPGSAGR